MQVIYPDGRVKPVCRECLALGRRGHHHQLASCPTEQARKRKGRRRMERFFEKLTAYRDSIEAERAALQA